MRLKKRKADQSRSVPRYSVTLDDESIDMAMRICERVPRVDSLSAALRYAVGFTNSKLPKEVKS